MSPFQATTTALASTVGMGNIAGVATALSVGGPGAIFWMWILAILGMMTKTAEITLAVHYRDTDEKGTLQGGPMYYITRGLGWSSLAKIFSLGVVVNSLLSSALIQPHTVGRAFLKSYSISPYLITLGMALITMIVVIGGIRRIGQVCEKLVPTMAIVYLLAGFILLILRIDQIPEVFGAIFRHAWAPAPAVGGFAGATVVLAIKEGMAKGMLSNEAGLGTAPMVHATADTNHPFRQGVWGAFEVFVDTLVICTLTSFVVLSTDLLQSPASGIELVIDGFASIYSEPVAGPLISFCILVFCLTTQIGFFIYFRTAMVHVFGRKIFRWVKWIYFTPGILFAGVANVDQLWIFANIAVGVCAIPNLIAVIAMRKSFFGLMKDYLSGTHRYATERVDVSGEYIQIPKKRHPKS
jgi:AGCS family alanine or glycine:cation symporter